ncbi:hypothetical protein [Microbacterium sp.]|uniref:hypothetical protein n=1 Tax=Microbacterium sp. TaxID=51671 RepID=UPI0039E588BA
MFPAYDPLRLHIIEMEALDSALERTRRARERWADAASAPVRTGRAVKRTASRLAPVVRE